MAGYFKRILTPWGVQPQEPVEIHEDYAQYISTARLWNIPATVPAESIARGFGGYAKTGTIDVAVSTNGIGVKGDGSTGLYSRTVSVVPQAMWMAVQFVCNSVSTTQKVAYGLGSNAASTGAYCAISSGDSVSSNLVFQLRAIDSSVAIGKSGPAPVLGTVYNCIAVFPSNLKADAYVYVNGIKYTTDFSSSTDITFVDANTLVHEAVGALKRGTTAVYSSDTVLFTTRGLGQIPEALAKDISLNPYILLQPEERQVWVPVASGSPTVVTLNPATFDFAPQNTQNTLGASLIASALNFTAQDIQNSATNNLTAAAFDFVAHDIAAENASTATVTLDTATFDFVANDIQNTLRVELSTATCDFIANDIQNTLRVELTTGTFDFAGQDTQNTLGLLLENAIFDFVARSITAGDPLAPTTGRATNMMLMGVGN